MHNTSTNINTHTDPALSRPSAEVTDLDTLYEIETPEGIDLTARVAGPVPRLLAYSVDLFYRTLILLVLGIAIAFAGNAGVGLWLLTSFLLEWFYPVFFEVLRGGQTPGKRAFSIAVVNDNLTPISWGPSIMRNLLRFADFLPFGYCAGIISMTCSRDFQRLGDHAAGTLVVHRDQPAAPAALPEVTPMAPPRGLQLEDQQAIVSLIERSRELSRARQQELADLLQPITGKSGDDGLNRLHGIGRWLLGARTADDHAQSGTQQAGGR